MNVGESQIKDILGSYRNLAVYGLSPDPAKPSHYVPLYMREHGYQIDGVYPKPFTGGGFNVRARLAEVPPASRRFVNVFRRSEHIPQLIEEILNLGGTEVLWLQLGIHHAEAEARAEAAGLKVVSDRCLIIEHRRCFKNSN